MLRIVIENLQELIGAVPDGDFGAASRALLSADLTNLKAPALTAADFQGAADRLGVPVAMIKAVRKVEAPRGAFDDQGRPAILYERHVFSRNTVPRGKFDKAHSDLSAPVGYGKGGYGPFSAQFDRLAAACALDAEAAFRACSWGAFQVLGENAVKIGYQSAYQMAKALTVSEAAHLESFCRFVEANGLVDELRACRPGDPQSCVPFVKRYNGEGFATFAYHIKLASAAL